MNPRYKILRLLGEGGMGRVFLAEDRKENRRVALKFLPKDFDRALYEQFRKEVSFLSGLSHPNLIRVFDYEEEWNGEAPKEIAGDLTGPYYSMEFAQGEPLSPDSPPLGPKLLLETFVGLCRGLHYLHARGLLHRDLKPDNILVTAQGPKLLDFGLADLLKPGQRSAAGGTLTYMAPEARGGLYDTQSDIYSLGVIFSALLKGRDDIPDDFRQLTERMRTSDPSARPHSALALIKYLNQHGGKAFDLREESETASILSRVPWVSRPEEKQLDQALEAWRQGGGFKVCAVAGPTGIGRTRLIEEFRWRLRLEGVPFETVTPQEIETWAPPRAGTVVYWPDLHEWPARLWPTVWIALARLKRQNVPLLLITDYDSERLPHERKDWIDTEIELKDLNEKATRSLVRQATLDLAKPLPAKILETIVSESGGRPLLILDQLRSYLQNASQPFAPSKDIAQTATRQVGGLTSEIRTLLAKIVVHPEPVSATQIANSVRSSVDLIAQGLLSASAARTGLLALAHPALRSAYETAFTPQEIQEAHRQWLDILETIYGNIPNISPQAVFITHHALGAHDDDKAYDWGLQAMDTHLGHGDLNAALRLSDQLLDRAKDPARLCMLQARRAPIFYGLGRFDESLKAYDAWYALKPDDGTQVETVKHRLYTGLVYSSWGQTKEAKRRLTECLEAGDDAKHARHRPYHARAHILLAGLAERAGKPGEAGSHLDAAQPLAADQPLLLGEIEEKRGALAEQAGHFEDARIGYERSRTHFQSAGNPQAEAIAVNRMGMLDRLEGKLHHALELMNEAVTLSEKGGERLQNARYRENRALVLMDLALYGRALAEMDDVGDIFEAVGEPDDKKNAVAHRGELYRRLGNTSRSREELKTPIPHPNSEARRSVILFIEKTRGTNFSEDVLARLTDSIRRLEAPEDRIELYALLAQDLKKRNLPGVALLLQEAAAAELKDIHNALPEELKMDFEKNRDIKTLEQSLGHLVKPAAPAGKSIPESRFRQFCEINRKIALHNDLKTVLEEVIDAAIQISGAERGFVLLKNAKSKSGPVTGFEVRTARNLNHKTVADSDFELSIGLVKQAIEKGAYVLTEDALSDPRYAGQKSVMDYRLRSVLVLPLEQEGDVFGVVYLDHRYQPNCFSEEELVLLRALSSQASLAIQKARLIGELTASRDQLAGQVKEQEEKIEHLSEALNQKRESLRYGYEEIIGKSPSMMKVFQLLDHVTETSIPVWIHGESGTGKELIAKSLHFNSPRKNAPFVAENVSAIPETLLESELFGHKKGSFTHADRDRIGLFEQATGGTLFLDEVADMSLAMQAKLLRVLQEGEVRPVGASKTVKINVRLVTASNRDLARLVQDGKFRQDLFYRINGLTIELPPLRNRKDDLPLLARHILKRVSKEFNLPASEMTDKALQVLMKHDWPGNVRELEATLRNALLFAKGRPIAAEHLNLQPRAVMATPAEAYGAAPSAVATPEDERHKQLIMETLRKHELDKEKAAQELDVSLRTLYTWMEKYGIPKKKAVLAKHIGLS